MLQFVLFFFYVSKNTYWLAPSDTNTPLDASSQISVIYVKEE